MPQTLISGKQVKDSSIQRVDLDVSTVGQAVVAKLLQGTGIILSSTGADSGTGDVTVSGDPTTIWKGFIAKSAAYTLLSADSGKYIICSGGSWTLTLPAPVLGLIFQVRNDMGISGTTGTITLQPTGGTIDGLASIALLPQQECTIITDGTNWRTFGLKREVILGTQDIISSTAFGSVLLPVGYRYFELQFSGVVPVTSNDYVIGQLSVNGGSSWLATGYYHGYFTNSSISAVAFGDVENGSSLFICPQVAYASVPGQSQLIIFPGNAALDPSWTMDSGSRNSSAYQYKWNGYGVMGNAGPANALKYYMAAGNILNSFLTVKGIV